MQKIKKEVKALAIASFFSDVASEMIFPILPLFLANVLNINKSLIGLIEGISESFSSILKVISGYLSDKLRKRKIFMIMGYGIPILSKPILALSTSWIHALIFRWFDRTGKGLRTSPRDALIAEYSDKNTRGKYFGFHRTMDTLGAVVGVIITFLIINFFGLQYRLIFWFAIIPAFISLMIIQFYVKEKKDGSYNHKFKLDGLNKNFKIFIAISFLFSFANFSYTFFILRAQNYLFLIALIPIAYLVYNLSYAGAALPFGELSDKIGRKSTLIIGYLLFSLTTLGFAFAINTYMLWILFILYGLSIAIIETIPKAFISDITPKDKIGTALGFYFMVTGIVVLFSNITAGLLWDKLGVTVMFSFSAVISVIGAILLALFVKE